MSSLTSDEVNFLIYRYLLESGFVHSAFSFGNESVVARANIDGSEVAPGALISFLQKGLQYVEIETHINNDGTESICESPFSLVQPHKCLIKTKKRIFDPYEPVETDYGRLELDDETLMPLRGHSDMVTICKFRSNTDTLATGSADSTTRLWSLSNTQLAPSAIAQSSRVLTVANGTEIAKKHDQDGRPSKMQRTQLGAVAMPSSIAKHSIVSLDWNSAGTLLATGSFDSRLLIWSSAGKLLYILSTHKGPITTLKWQKDSNILVSAGLDTQIAVYEGITEDIDDTIANGTVKQEDASNSTSMEITTTSSSDGSENKSIGVSKAPVVLHRRGVVTRHSVDVHKAPVLDVCFVDAAHIISCSTDGVVLLTRLPLSSPKTSVKIASGSEVITESSVEVSKEKATVVSRFDGHSADVNTLDVSLSGKMLVTGSDDCTVKIWRIEVDATDSASTTQSSTNVLPLFSLDMHSKSISVVRWSPDADDSHVILATASLDTTVRVWDPETGECMYTFTQHSHPVTCMEFSPDGKVLATGGFDRVHFWSMKNGTLIKTFKGDGGGINSLTWNTAGTRLACGFSDHSMYVLDVREIL